MKSIHEILKAAGIEIPEDKKTDFEKNLFENYKTVSEVDKIKARLEASEKTAKELKSDLENINREYQSLKDNNASAEDFKKKYENLVSENEEKQKKQKELETEAAARSEFDKYFQEKKREWANPFIADGYFAKYKEAKTLEENKTKTSADILHELVKDDATAFKGTAPIILKGAEGRGGAYTKADFNKMNYSQKAELFQNNPELYRELKEE